MTLIYIGVKVKWQKYKRWKKKSRSLINSMEFKAVTIGILFLWLFCCRSLIYFWTVFFVFCFFGVNCSGCCCCCWYLVYIRWILWLFLRCRIFYAIARMFNFFFSQAIGCAHNTLNNEILIEFDDRNCSSNCQFGKQ